MKPIAFREANRISGDGKKSIEAPVALRPFRLENHESGTIATFCYGLTLRDRLRLLFTGCVWLTTLTHTRNLPPMKLELSKPKHLAE